MGIFNIVGKTISNVVGIAESAVKITTKTVKNTAKTVKDTIIEPEKVPEDIKKTIKDIVD